MGCGPNERSPHQHLLPEISARNWLTPLLLILSMTLGACATYEAQPLPELPDLDKDLTNVPVNTLRNDLPRLAPHKFDAGVGLDMTDVATVAVVNNPNLKAARRKADVANAQAFAAGLLPDPQVSFSFDHPTTISSSLIDAFGLGLNYNFGALITRGARIDVATAEIDKVNLDILWQEWQAIQQSRNLFVQFIHQERKLDLLRQVQQIYADRYANSSRALSRGDLTLGSVGTDLTAVLDASTQMSQLERQIDQTRHDLNALLGLAPEASIELSALDAPRLLPKGIVDKALTTLAKRRPDLLALQAGYRSQEANVWRAVLAQFPSISVGVTRARDTSNVHTIGLGVSLSLPLFDGNRGDVAIQKATRAQLKQEYQARLDQTYGEVDLLWKRQTFLKQQLEIIETYLPQLELMVREARIAYQRQDFGALTYLNMENTLLQKRLEREDLEQEVWVTGIALDTLLGWPEGTVGETQEGQP